MQIFLTSEVKHDKDGFEALAHLWEDTEGCFGDDIEINLAKTRWFDADMCAAFGAILYRLRDNLNSVKLTQLQLDVEKILLKSSWSALWCF